MHRPWSSRKASAIAVVAILSFTACLAALGPATRPAQAAVDYVFNVDCPISHFSSDDPIVFPKEPGASHRHAFYGNPTTDASSTTGSLLASASTCQRGFRSADRSAYWIPSLYRKTPDGTVREVRLSSDDQHLSAYYRRTGGPIGVKVSPFPKGLRMLAGDPHATRPQDTADVAWRCNGDGRDPQAGIPNCTAGTILQAFVFFPDCWDGRNLDSPDHRSHMALSQGDRGSCPSTHPVKLPQLSFEVTFNLPPVLGATYQLSSGGQYSLHGDFFAAWDDRVQSALVNSCLNDGRFCFNINRSDVDLSRATPVRAVPEPATSGLGKVMARVPGGHASHGTGARSSASATPGAPTAPPTTATTLRRTADQSALGGVVSAGVAGTIVAVTALYYWRRRAVRARR